MITTESTSPITGFDVHGAQGPTIPGEPSLAARKALAQQEAERDAANHVDDSYSIAARGGLLLGQVTIDRETGQLQERARIAKRDALLTNEQHIERARAEGVDGVSIEELERQLGSAMARRGEAIGARQRSVDILTGAKPDPWGRVLTGTVPDETSAWRFLAGSAALTAFLSLLEAVPGFFTARLLLNTSDVVAVTAMGLLLATALFLIPITIGETLKGKADPQEEPTRAQSIRRILLVGGLGAIWLWLVMILGMSRGDATSAVRDAGQIGFGLSTQMLVATFLLVGAALMWLHASGNPHRTKVVQYNGIIARLDKVIEKLRGRITRSKALVAMQELQRDATDDLYDHHIDRVLPAQGEEVKDVYRREYVRLVGDTAVTDAVMQPWVPEAGDPKTDDSPEPGTIGPGSVEGR